MGAIAVAIVAGIGFVALGALLRKATKHEARTLQMAFLAHAASAVFQVLVTEHVYGSGDMTEYWHQGVMIAESLRRDFSLILPQVLGLIFQQEETRFPFQVYGIGAPTGTMAGISGLLMYALADSLYAACLLVSLSAVVCKSLLYRALKDRVPAEFHLRVMIAVLLVPSAVFWSSGLLKESVVMGPLCLMVYALLRVRGTLSSLVAQLPVFFLGALVIGLVKPYVLFPFALAAGVWIYSRRVASGRTRALPPIYLVGGLALGFTALIGLGELFPTFAIERVAEEAANQQRLGSRIEGGSNYTIGDPERRSLIGQLAFAPLALVTSLFRPFVFEARNLLMAISAIEATVFISLLVLAAYRRGWRQLKALILSSPVLMFSVTFCVVFGVAVGLGSTNLGTLSRYRSPMLPFYGCVLLILAAPQRQRHAFNAGIDVAR
jgi:uncharacterized membrane protein (DUF485 family)